MSYQVYTPSVMLQPIVKCFWSLDEPAQDQPVVQRVVPDGCMEMIFHYGDPFRQYFSDGQSIEQPLCFIYGQINRYIEIAPMGASGIIAARFWPNGLSPLLPIPIADLEDKATALEDIFGSEGEQLGSNVLGSSNTAERILIIEGFLINRLNDADAMDKVAKTCVDVLLQSQGKMDVHELADKLQLHRRQIERKFSSGIGMSPKQLARVIRLQSALKSLDLGQFGSLTSIAYDNGYYDQAHFIRDFKEFTGVSPKSFYAQNLRLSALFASGD